MWDESPKNDAALVIVPKFGLFNASGGVFSFERQATARLIEAAPDMLDALDRVLADDRLMNAMSPVQARAILDAVKKARGGK